MSKGTKDKGTSPLAELYKELVRKSAAEARAKAKLDEAKTSTAQTENAILDLLRAQREQGLAAKAVMKNGVTLSEGDRRPWCPIAKERTEEVKQELLRLELSEFLGAPKYGEMKSQYGEVSELPGKLKDLVVQGHAYYLSVTKGKAS